MFDESGKVAACFLFPVITRKSAGRRMRGFFSAHTNPTPRSFLPWLSKIIPEKRTHMRDLFGI